MNPIASVAASVAAQQVQDALPTGGVLPPGLEEAIGTAIVGGGITVFSQMLGMLQQNLNRLPPES